MSSLPIMPCKKIPYPSRGDATRAAKAAPGQQPYECPHCGAFHLSSKSKREVKAMRRRGDASRKIASNLAPLIGNEADS